MTPEGKVKGAINAVLDLYGDRLYRYMPVPGGYGKPTVDYLCCFEGKFFAIEAKAPGKKPTLRQEQCLEDMRMAGGFTFIIDSRDVSALCLWLAEVDEKSRK